MSIPTQLMTKLLPLPIFEGLSEQEGAELFEAATEKTVGRGATLFNEGDEGDALVIILSGDVQVTRRGVELATLGQHTVLGEMGLVSDEPRSATAVALSEVKLVTIPSRGVKALIKRDSVAALKVVANLAAVMSKRLAAINDRLVNASAPAGQKREELADFGRILTSWQF